MNSQIVATAAPDRMCGANAIVRTAPRPFSGRLNRNASASPITRLPATIKPVNTIGDPQGLVEGRVGQRPAVVRQADEGRPGRDHVPVGQAEERVVDDRPVREDGDHQQIGRHQQGEQPVLTPPPDKALTPASSGSAVRQGSGEFGRGSQYAVRQRDHLGAGSRDQSARRHIPRWIRCS